MDPRRACYFLVFVLFAAGAAASGVIQEDQQILDGIALGEREAAMGGTGAALSRGVYAPYWNVAGLGQTREIEFSAMQMLGSKGICLGSFGYSQLLSDSRAIGLQLAVVNAGDVRRGMGGAETGDFESGFFSLSGGISQQFYQGLWVGGLIRAIYQELDDGSQAFMSFDAGMRYDFQSMPISIGLSIHDVLELNSFKTVKAGVAYSALDGFLTFSVDAVLPEYDLHGGAELSADWGRETFAFRTGYLQDKGLGGFTGGLGIRTNRIPGKVLAFDYAYVPFGFFGAMHQFGLTLQFAGYTPADPTVTPEKTIAVSRKKDTPIPTPTATLINTRTRTPEPARKTPAAKPTVIPTLTPTAAPTPKPTAIPTLKPTAVPSAKSTVIPTEKPTVVVTLKPTQNVPKVPPTGLKFKVLDKNRIQVSWRPIVSPDFLGYNLFSIDPDQPEIRDKVNIDLLIEPNVIFQNIDRSRDVVLVVAAVYEGAQNRFSDPLTIKATK